MKTRICFYCEKDVPENKVYCAGGPFALRHFCTCSECFEKFRVSHFFAEPPINHYGTWIEISHRVLNACEHFAIDVDSPPLEPMSIRDLLDWIGECVWEDLGQNAELPDPPKVDGLGRRAVPLSEILKARESHPEQLSFPMPPKGARVLGRFGDGTEYFKVDPDELP